MRRIGIIGGGIIGLSIAWELSKFNDLKVVVYEKENKIAAHQTGRNSGVIHCGISYQFGSLKAKLATNGSKKLVSFCLDHEIPFELCGKLMIATNPIEEESLKKLKINGNKNGLKNLKLLQPSEYRKIEPNVAGTLALQVPDEGIVNYQDVTNKLKELFLINNGEINYNQKLNKIQTTKAGNLLIFDNSEEIVDLVINCAGLYSDTIYKRSVGESKAVKIIPFKGTYYNLKKDKESIFNNLVYPAPNPRFPFLGVHFTRQISGSRIVGPNAALALGRESYKSNEYNLRDLREIFTFKPFYKFLFNNSYFVLKEGLTTISAHHFLKEAQRLIPDLNLDHFEHKTSGIRAQAMDQLGELIDDFRIEVINNQIHVINAPSPAATSCLAIANYIIDNYLQLIK